MWQVNQNFTFHDLAILFVCWIENKDESEYCFVKLWNWLYMLKCVVYIYKDSTFKLVSDEKHSSIYLCLLSPVTLHCNKMNPKAK